VISAKTGKAVAELTEYLHPSGVAALQVITGILNGVRCSPALHRQ